MSVQTLKVVTLFLSKHDNHSLFLYSRDASQETIMMYGTDFSLMKFNNRHTLNVFSRQLTTLTHFLTLSTKNEQKLFSYSNAILYIN